MSFPLALVTYHYQVASIPLTEVIGESYLVSACVSNFRILLRTKLTFLASTSSNLFLSVRSSEEAFNDCLGVSNVFPITAGVQF